jgi:two-component system sensor histidine kinase/response regulator
VQQASEQLLTLITEMIDFTGFQTKQLNLLQKPLQITTVLDRLTKLLGPDAQRKGLALTLDSQPELSKLALQGDELRLGQILLAITAHAIKFTTQGSVTVRVTLFEETPRDMVLCLEVRDTGIGVAPIDQRRIFGLFEQADRSSTRRYGRTGLGLALSRQMIELMGGEFGVESQPGVGAVFWFMARLNRLEPTP